jgi:hypothetical protein
LGAYHLWFSYHILLYCRQPGREVQWPRLQRYLVSLVAMMEEMHFAAMSPNAIPCHLFGSAKLPFFGKMLSLICCQNRSFCQNRANSFKNMDSAPLLRHLKAPVRIPFFPGLFSSGIFWRAVLISSKVGGVSSAVLVGHG